MLLGWGDLLCVGHYISFVHSIPSLVFIPSVHQAPRRQTNKTPVLLKFSMIKLIQRLNVDYIFLCFSLSSLSVVVLRLW
jgi:hypothetical protein